MIMVWHKEQVFVANSLEQEYSWKKSLQISNETSQNQIQELCTLLFAEIESVQTLIVYNQVKNI